MAEMDASGTATGQPQLVESPAIALPAPRWLNLQAVPMRVAITVPVVGMKLRDLRRLTKGFLLETATCAAEDVPVRVGGVVLGWGELDHVDGQMAVRLTRLT